MAASRFEMADEQLPISFSDTEIQSALLQICESSEKGGFDHRQVQLALMYEFRDEKNVYVPHSEEMTGADAILSLDALKARGYDYVAFSFAVNRKHQIAAWVNLTSDYAATLVDSEANINESSPCLISLRRLLGHDVEIKIDSSSFSPQSDSWSCGVYVIAHLKAFYQCTISSNIVKDTAEKKALTINEFAKMYYLAYRRQEIIEQDKSERREFYDKQKRKLLELLEAQTKTMPHLQSLADYLQQILWGNIYRDNPHRINQSQETMRVWSMEELLLHYQIDNTTDTPGLLILKIAAIFSEASSQDLENLYQYLLPSMDYFSIADEKRNGDVLLTNALLYEAPEEKEKQKNILKNLLQAETAETGIRSEERRVGKEGRSR